MSHPANNFRVQHNRKLMANYIMCSSPSLLVSYMEANLFFVTTSTFTFWLSSSVWMSSRNGNMRRNINHCVRFTFSLHFSSSFQFAFISRLNDGARLVGINCCFPVCGIHSSVETWRNKKLKCRRFCCLIHEENMNAFMA